jgi:hypothetical protein
MTQKEFTTDPVALEQARAEINAVRRTIHTVSIAR